MHSYCLWKHEWGGIYGLLSYAAIMLIPWVNVLRRFALCCLPVAHHIARGLFEDDVRRPYMARALGYVPSLSTLCI